MNADSIPDTGTGVVGTNMFAYCNNSPIGFIDPDGHSFQAIVAICAILGAFIGAVIGYSLVSKEGYTVKDGWNFWKYILGGIVLGGIVGGVAGAAGAKILGSCGGAYFPASGAIARGSTETSLAMERIRQLGQLGEKLANIKKNTAHIVSLSNTAKYRIPDILDKSLKIIGDVKYVNKLSLTKQLKDYLLFAEKYGYKFVLYVKPETRLTTTLKQLVDAGRIVVVFITERR